MLCWLGLCAGNWRPPQLSLITRTDLQLVTRPPHSSCLTSGGAFNHSLVMLLDLVRFSSLSYWRTKVWRCPCCCWNGTKINWATRKAFLSRHAPSPDLSSVLNIRRVWSRLRLHLHMQWGRGRMSTQHRPSGARHGSSGQGYSGELQSKPCMGNHCKCQTVSRVDATVMGSLCNGQIIEPYSCSPFFITLSTPKLNISVPVSISCQLSKGIPTFPYWSIIRGLSVTSSLCQLSIIWVPQKQLN